MSNQNIINPKPCNYGCGTRIYWDTISNSFLEVFTKQRHLCKNRSTTNQQKSTIHNSVVNNKPNYYNRFTKQPKPKMSNSLELLSGPIDTVKKQYEVLSDIVSEYNGKVHGSQSQVNSNNISLVVYFEVPAEGNVREMVKQKFNNFILSVRPTTTTRF
jgi:hypothetical protein